MSADDMEIAEHKEGTNEVVKIFIIDSIRNSGTPGAYARALEINHQRDKSGI